MPKGADGLPAAVLKVDGQEYRLNEGEFMLWDDTFEHEVWNDSDQVRTVLLLDIRRRDLPRGLRILSSGIIALVRLNVRVIQRQF
ncbi:Aspartyl/Asparaginyl beta-hydroxylase [compost metagenome]